MSAADSQSTGATVITGAARGIGAAIAQLVAADGRPVVLLDRDGEMLGHTAAHLRATGARCVAIACDVSDENQVIKAFGAAREHLGPLAALVTAASIDRGGLAHELDTGTWDEVIAADLRGTFLACREALRTMRSRGGAIVCMSSPFAHVAANGVTAYGASKAGVCALVRSLAVDYACDGIRVNALLPGPTETEMMWANVPTDQVDATRQTFCRKVPLARLADPDEIARAALWLLSDAASYVTGAQLSCDGGVMARAALSV
jgi:NAD(P)-dependent dehydrogenase (short-subunit alcohol dehydrogenase family)